MLIDNSNSKPFLHQASFFDPIVNREFRQDGRLGKSLQPTREWLLLFRYENILHPISISHLGFDQKVRDILAPATNRIAVS